jgi:hypothetical protein
MAKPKIIPSNTKALLKFLMVILILVGLGLLYHFKTDQGLENTQRFFENRKDVQEYHKYKEDEESAKKRAEKNIFLQN